MRTFACAGRAVPPAAIGFRPEFLDFRRGIRVGKLEEHERITQILKLALEAEFGEPFVTERWGRGMYWQWIGYLPRTNRAAKPESAHVSFGCSKFFVMVDAGECLFKCGMQVERGYLKAPREYRECELRSDWDWHRLQEPLSEGADGTGTETIGSSRGLPDTRGQLGTWRARFFQGQFPRRVEALQGA